MAVAAVIVLTFEFMQSKTCIMHTTSRYNHDCTVWREWSKEPFIKRDPQKARKGLAPIRIRDIKREARKAAAMGEKAVAHGKAPANRDTIFGHYVEGARCALGDIAFFDATSTNKVKLFVDRSRQLLSSYENQERSSNDKVTVYRRRESSPDDNAAANQPGATNGFDPIPPCGSVLVFRSQVDAMDAVALASASLMVAHLTSRCTARIHPNGQHVKSEEYRTASFAAQRAIEKLVGATPWVLGWRPPDNRRAGKRSRSLSPDLKYGWEDEDEDRDICSLMSFFLWPIFSAAGSEFASRPQQRYMVSALRFIGRERGMKQAEALAKIVEGEFHDDTLKDLVASSTKCLGDVGGLMY